MAIIKVNKVESNPDIIEGVIVDETPQPVPLSIRSEAEEMASLVVLEARALIINSDIDRQLAYDFVADKVRRGLQICDMLFDKNIKLWHQGHKSAVKDKKDLAQPFLDAETIAKAKIQKYDLEKRNAALEEQRKLQEQLQQSAEKRATEKIVTLLESESEEDKVKAERLMSKLEEGSIKPVPIPMPEPKGLPGSRVLKRYKVIDKSKMDIDYLVPDNPLIQSVVDREGKGAETIVGEGSIEVFEVGSVAIRKK